MELEKELRLASQRFHESLKEKKEQATKPDVELTRAQQKVVIQKEIEQLEIRRSAYFKEMSALVEEQCADVTVSNAEATRSRVRKLQTVSDEIATKRARLSKLE